MIQGGFILNTVHCSSANTERNNVTSRIRGKALLLTLAFALIALVAIPASASAFNIANFKITPSTTQAGGHPNVTLAFDRQGSESEDITDVAIDLPTGFFGNPESANPKCTDTQFNTDKCPTASQVGTATTNITAASVLDQTVNGTIYILTPRANDAATLGILLRPAKICILLVFCSTPNKIFLKTGLAIRSFDNSGLRTTTNGTPQTSTIGIPLIVTSGSATLDVTIKKMSLTMQGKANSSNSGPYFVVASTSCQPSVATATITSNSGVKSSMSSSYQPTGCPSVPFNPTVSFTPASVTSGQAVATTFVLNVPQANATIQNAHPKVVDVDLPNGSGLFVNALAGVTGCSETELRANTCAASTQIGTASAVAPMLPPGFSGKVFAMDPVGTQVPIAIRLEGPRASLIIIRGVLGIRGDVAAGTGHVYARFDAIPQVPYSQFTLNLTKPLYKNPDTCTSAAWSASITGHNGTAASSGNGTNVVRTGSYTPTSCAPAPDTTITSGPPSTTVDNTPTFAFTSTIAGSTFQCKIDSDPYQLCTTPYTTATLANGAHTFSVYAVNGLTPDATPATYAFNVNIGNGFTITPTITPDTTQAAAHPNVSAQFDVVGGQPKTLQVKFPDGFAASLNAVTPCATATALAGDCPAASQIGTVQATVDVFGGPETGTGTVYLTDGPTSADAGGMAVKIQFSFGTLITNAGAYLINNGKNQNLDFRDLPSTVGSTSFTIQQLKLNFSGANRFLTNSSSCAANSWQSTGTAYDGTPAAALTVAYQATGCPTVPFAPTVSQTLSNNAAGSLTGITANVTLPQDNGTIRALRINEPPALGPNFPAFGVNADQCPTGAIASAGATFDPTNCPPQARVGQMTITTPLLVTPLVGDIYLVNKSPLPWFGVKFDQPGISIRLNGITSTPQVDPACDPLTDPMGFCQTQISTSFSGVPDTPVSTVKFDLNGPDRAGANGVTLSGNMLVVAQPGDSTCQASSPAKWNSTSWTGATASGQEVMPFVGC